MRFHKFSIALLMVCAPFLHAEDEAPKEEPKGNVIQPLPREEKEYFEKTARLNSLTTRIEEAEKQFNILVRNKAAEKDPAERARIIKQLNEVTADRNKASDEFNRVKSEIETRYPNRGAHLNRRYQTQSRKTTEQMENGASGLDEQLTKTKKVIDKKYAPFDDDDEKRKKSEVQTEKSETEKPERLKLEK